MALSKIWSAFIIIAILLAGFKCFFVNGQQDIFSRMVTGKADDAINYYAIGSPAGTGIQAIDSFSRNVESFGYRRAKKPEEANAILTDNITADSVLILTRSNPGLRIFTYQQVLNRLVKPVDG